MKNILKDGAAEISNNLCEQRMKPVKLLLKNCMNIGSEYAAENRMVTKRIWNNFYYIKTYCK